MGTRPCLAPTLRLVVNKDIKGAVKEWWRRGRRGIRAASAFGLMAATREGIMRAASLVLVSGALAMSPSFADAQVAGSTKLGVGMVDVKLVAVGWSARKDIIGKTVYNENDQRVGTIEDLIVAPDSAISFAIVGAGGFAGVGRHDVAIPVRQIHVQDSGKFVLPGATEEAIKSLPRFEYTKGENE
jgi:sporulation protein YlmC with PRC-barrel domain